MFEMFRLRTSESPVHCHAHWWKMIEDFRDWTHAVPQVPLYYWCAHFAGESEKTQLHRRWRAQMGILLVGTGALIAWSMLLENVIVSSIHACIHTWSYMHIHNLARPFTTQYVAPQGHHFALIHQPWRHDIIWNGACETSTISKCVLFFIPNTLAFYFSMITVFV